MNVEKGVYRHNKSGKLYEVIGTALQTETDEMLVIYRPLSDNKFELFARPRDMFAENVVLDGQEVPRFERLDEHECRNA